jgi:hypothetical protein
VDGIFDARRKSDTLALRLPLSVPSLGCSADAGNVGEDVAVVAGGFAAADALLVLALDAGADDVSDFASVLNVEELAGVVVVSSLG